MFSLTKLLTFILIIVAVWYGFKLVTRLQQDRAKNLKAEREAARNPKRVSAEDMAQCAVCGVYVPSAGARKCGRSNCPQG